MSIALALAAAAAIVLFVGSPRTTPRLLDDRAQTADRADPTAALASLGAVVLRALRVPSQGRAGHAGQVAAGLAAVLVPVAALIGVVGAGLLGGVVALAARASALRRGRRSRLDPDDHLPDLVDLLHLAVSAGCPLPHAFDLVADQVPAALADGVDEVRRRRRSGVGDVDSVAGLRAVWGESAAPLVAAATDHLRDGVAAGPALARVADELRHQRRRRAETRARRLPVLLLFPLVVCILPAFGLLTVAPLVSTTIDSLTGSPLEADASCPATEGTVPCP